MAETAKIVNPDKKVIIPDMDAGCSLADSAPEEKFRKWINQHPDHIVISYINCSAEVKALSDIICTSANAKKVVESIPKDKKNLLHTAESQRTAEIAPPSSGRSFCNGPQK